MILKEQQKKWCRTYYLKNRDKVLAHNKKYRLENKEKVATMRKNYSLNNRPKIALTIRSWTERKRKEAIKKLGSVCTRCGYKDERALVIHHKNIMTKTHRRDWLKKDYDFEQLELICANCHAVAHHLDYKKIMKKY